MCGSDIMALGVIQGVRSGGLRVPEDVSVIGYDDSPLIPMTDPPLTTVRQDFRRAGEEMVRLVLEQVDSGAAGGERQILIPTELVVRGSTAPRRERT